MRIIVIVVLVIISPNLLAGNWVQVKNWSTPLEVNTVAMENMLWEYIAGHSKEQFLPRDSYTYQYKTINGSELFINALCKSYNEEELADYFIVVFDGGSCFFQATYNFKSNKFVSLEVNGEA